jgi:hypothetical protein
MELLLRQALTGDYPLTIDVRVQIEVALAYALMHQLRFQEAHSVIAAALTRSPGDDQAQLCDAQLSFFMDEPWPGPWKKLEARWTTGYMGDQPVPSDRLWDGSPLRGRSVLLAGEGGLGDQINFVRFAATLKAAGAGRVIVSAHPPLIPLFETMSGIDALVPTRMPSNTLRSTVDYDVAVPMASVPRYCSPSATPWPLPPYLHAVPAGTAAVQRQITETGAVLNVGLCWNASKATRRIPLEMFRPLAEVPGVRLFALGEEAAVQRDIGDFPILSLAASDVQTTAAAIAALDLVVTVDTMTAHLAGALDRPAWVLLHYLPDWRWRANGDSTAWYPSMRLFRQAQRDWRPAIAGIVIALEQACHRAGAMRAR